MGMLGWAGRYLGKGQALTEMQAWLLSIIKKQLVVSNCQISLMFQISPLGSKEWHWVSFS